MAPDQMESSAKKRTSRRKEGGTNRRRAGIDSSAKKKRRRSSQNQPPSDADATNAEAAKAHTPRKAVSSTPKKASRRPHPSSSEMSLEESSTVLSPNGTKRHRHLPVTDEQKHVFCLDHTRVVLKQVVNGSDYIHASWVTGAPLVNKFICTQGPLEKSAVDFWRMVVQERVETIVMLCETIETGRPKCFQYWPRQVDDKLEFDGIRVKTKSVTTDPHTQLVISTLQLKVGGKSQKVRHFIYKTWPDRSIPNAVDAPLHLLKVARASKRPTIVHCSAGIGRTGALVAVEMCIQTLLDRRPLDVPATVRLLRSQRLHCIQTAQQLVYVYKCVMEFGVRAEVLRPGEQKTVAKFFDQFNRLLTEGGVGGHAPSQSNTPMAASPHQPVVLKPPPPPRASKEVASKEQMVVEKAANTSNRDRVLVPPPTPAATPPNVPAVVQAAPAPHPPPAAHPAVPPAHVVHPPVPPVVAHPPAAPQTPPVVHAPPPAVHAPPPVVPHPPAPVASQPAVHPVAHPAVAQGHPPAPAASSVPTASPFAPPPPPAAPPAVRAPQMPAMSVTVPPKAAAPPQCSPTAPPPVGQKPAEPPIPKEVGVPVKLTETPPPPTREPPQHSVYFS
ncbi:Tyrosine-protein phosphatase 69D [Aphelenchoides fujianensis]|nr:Tyrosine-protein phosphatase 69D [Aphelenchoides fujianensis]